MANRAQTQQQNYYTNPAFCQKSEYYAIERDRRALSPVRSDKSARQSPLGAQATVHNNELSPHKQNRIVENNDEYEQEFYEEMLVDDTGYVQEKKILVISSPQKEKVQKRAGSRYAPIVLEDTYQQNKERYEYIPVQYDNKEEIIASSGKIHRYALIPNSEDENTQRNKKPNGGTYSLVPLEEIQSKNRYAFISENDSRYEYIEPEEKQCTRPNAPRTAIQRRESYRQTYQQQNCRQQEKYMEQNYHNPQQQQQQPVRRGNPIATQKLHELLQSPKQTKQTPRKIRQLSPNIIINNSPPRKQIIDSKIHQQLRSNMDYATKNTAIVQPICSNSSVYSDTTTINKSDSWMNLNLKKPAVQGTLAAAALMMFLCGGVTSGLCFYMISIMGKLYFLDFGIVSGFTCLLLGILGFRTRNCYWLPNRNYISGMCKYEIIYSTA